MDIVGLLDVDGWRGIDGGYKTLLGGRWWGVVVVLYLDGGLCRLLSGGRWVLYAAGRARTHDPAGNANHTTHAWNQSGSSSGSHSINPTTHCKRVEPKRLLSRLHINTKRHNKPPVAPRRYSPVSISANGFAWIVTLLIRTGTFGRPFLSVSTSSILFNVVSTPSITYPLPVSPTPSHLKTALPSQTRYSSHPAVSVVHNI